MPENLANSSTPSSPSPHGKQHIFINYILQAGSSINVIPPYLLVPWVSERSQLLGLSIWKVVGSNLN